MYLRNLISIFLIAVSLTTLIHAQDTTAHKKQKSLTIGIGGNIPTGPWRNKATAGAGIHVKYEVNISKTVTWFLQAGYTHFWGKESSFGSVSYTTSYDYGEFGTGIEIHAKNGYFGLIGLTVNTFAQKTNVTQIISGWKQETRTNQQSERFGLIMGGGYVYPLIDNLDIEGTLAYNYMGNEGSNLSLIAGLKIKFY